VVVWGEINPGDELSVKRQESQLSNMISQKRNWFIPEALVQFHKSLVRRLKMGIYPDVRTYGAK
jgi:hypothetical protein